MLYTIPDYYKKFTCTADRCEDTCCAGWQIMIDRRSLQRYVREKGGFANTLRRGISWRNRCFKQNAEGRCVFLDKDNLCDMYKKIGPDALCRTCRRYPRHIEEFENIREITLSASCPEVARILMTKKEPVKFFSYEKERWEEYEEFDLLLHSILMDARDVMLRIVQNRELDLRVRAGLLTGLAHDMQRRIDRGNLFACQELFERYETDRAKTFVETYLEKQTLEKAYETIHKNFRRLYGLELLRKDWEQHLIETETILYQKGPEQYAKIRTAFDAWILEYFPEWNVQCEQLLVYFISTYFCGAVYDGDAFSKVWMSVISVSLVYEMLAARWIKNEKVLDTEDVIEIVYRFSREVEHSDENLRRMESWACKSRR